MSVKTPLDVKWNMGTLTVEDIAGWLVPQPETTLLEFKDFRHVCTCLHHIYEWYHGKRPLGRFLRAIVRNDFVGACGKADGVNIRVLPVYARFLYNVAPADWRKKGRTIK